MAKERGFEPVKNAPADTILPKRATKHSAAHDFCLPCNVIIGPKTYSEPIALNVKAYMQGDEVLHLYIRSSLGVKKRLLLANGTGVIDSDYYSNEDNDGNIYITLYNNGIAPVRLVKGERVAQGEFNKYLLADGDKVTTKRKGGTGSTDKRETK